MSNYDRFVDEAKHLSDAQLIEIIEGAYPDIFPALAAACTELIRRYQSLEDELWQALTGESPEETEAFKKKFAAWRKRRAELDGKEG